MEPQTLKDRHACLARTVLPQNLPRHGAALGPDSLNCIYNPYGGVDQVPQTDLQPLRKNSLLTQRIQNVSF